MSCVFNSDNTESRSEPRRTLSPVLGLFFVNNVGELLIKAKAIFLSIPALNSAEIG